MFPTEKTGNFLNREATPPWPPWLLARATITTWGSRAHGPAGAQEQRDKLLMGDIKQGFMVAQLRTLHQERANAGFGNQRAGFLIP